MPVVSWRDVVQADHGKVLLLDTRTPAEYAFGSIEGAVNIPLDDLRDRLDEIPKDKEIYTFCAVGLRGYLAQQILRAHGFTRVKNLSGGYKTYSAAVAPLSDQPGSVPSQISIDMGTQIKNDVKVVRVECLRAAMSGTGDET